MGKKLELKGQTFGRLTVIKEEPVRSNDGKVKWFCKCDCGNNTSTTGKDLKSGDTKSCGCLVKEWASKSATIRNTTHGLCEHPLYIIWRGMRVRCYKKWSKNYKNYGDRGITVCDSWEEDFINFYNDMLLGYKEGLQLDRVDNDKGYYKENCRWVTNQQNQTNKGSKIGSTSKYKGVCWYRGGNRWLAQIYKDGKHYHLGTFKCEHEAAKAYNTKALELNSEYAYLNKIED